MSNSNVRWEPIDYLINDSLLEVQADALAVTVGYDNVALATFAWPENGQYAVCRAVPVEQPQPDWSQAPEWAMWWTVNPTGLVNWSRDEPFASTTGYGHWAVPPPTRWHIQGVIEIPIGIDWRLCKERRPEVRD